jgi:hypothetical protein
MLFPGGLTIFSGLGKSDNAAGRRIKIDPQQHLFRDGVGIDSDCVVMPVGMVILIGRLRFFGGIKFLHNEERADGTSTELRIRRAGPQNMVPAYNSLLKIWS